MSVEQQPTREDDRTTGSSLLRWLGRLPRQIVGGNPFGGNELPSRVPLLFQTGRSTLPFPHRWNYDRPLEILAAYFAGAERLQGAGRHNRYWEVPGFSPVLVSRDPGMIRAILTATGERSGQFDRDTLPSTGIARATGVDTLLFANGTMWRRQRKVSASPFGKTALFQVEVFGEFQERFRATARDRLAVLRRHLLERGVTRMQLAVEPEVKALMLEMLVSCFFGAEVDSQELREVYVPALERVIDHIVRDTVVNRLGLPRRWLALVHPGYARAARDFATFERLTDLVLSGRNSRRGLWQRFESDVPDAALRANLKVFLAGALEATTSYATWAISHLARHPSWQEAVYREIETVGAYTPERLESAGSLTAVLDETLRFTPSLYFLPRKATVDTRVETADGRVMLLPRGTHILLDVWHANRHEDHWGTAATGFPADQFAPERWERLRQQSGRSKEFLHFGFGHGPRVCPGKHLGQLEVALVVGVFVKLFRFTAPHAANPARAGVSTKPADGTLLELELRPPSAGMSPDNDPRLYAAQRSP